MPDPARVRYLVEHYAQLQRLRLVPLGLVFVAVACWHDGQLGWLPGTADGGIRHWFLGALAVAVLASDGIGAYSRRLFGGAYASRESRRGTSVLATAVAVFVSMVLQDAYRWPLSAPLVVVGIVLARIGVAQGRLRGHYLGIGVACLIDHRK